MFKKIFIIFFTFFISFNVLALEEKTKSQILLEEDLLEEIEMVVGDIYVFKADLPTRVSVRNPEILDIQKVSEREVVVVAKSKGITYFVFWDKKGEHPYSIKVLPENIDYINSQIIRTLPSSFNGFV